MSYTVSIDTIRKVESFLKILSETKEHEIVWSYPDPKQLQYYIHGGINSAFKLHYQPYESLKNQWKISISLDDLTVIAKRKPPIKELEAPLKISREFADAHEFIQYMIEEKPLYLEIPDTVIETVQVVNWLTLNNYTIAVSNNNVTIKKEIKND